MDWIHCNKCYCQPGAPQNRKFLLTNCSHIFCDQCNNGSMKSCACCQRDCTSIRIESGMIKELNMYFNDPDKVISQQLKVVEFQKGHRRNFLNHLKEEIGNLTKRNLQLEEEIKVYRERKNKYRDEIIKANNKNCLLQDKLANERKIMQQRPPMSGHSWPSNSGLHHSQFSSSLNKPSSSNIRTDLRTNGTSLQNTPFLQNTPLKEVNFRQLSTSVSPRQNDTHLFTPPLPVTSQRSYRDPSFSLKPLKSPIPFTPSAMKNTPQRSLKKVVLPGDKGISTPIGLARLSLKTPMSYMSNPPSAVRKVGRLTPSPKCVNDAVSKYYKYM